MINDGIQRLARDSQRRAAVSDIEVVSEIEAKRLARRKYKKQVRVLVEELGASSRVEALHRRLDDAIVLLASRQTRVSNGDALEQVLIDICAAFGVDNRDL